MAAVGGMLASAVIKVVIGQIGSAIGGKIKLHKNFRKDLENMKMTLESVEAVLSDAERLSITDNSARLWLKRLQDAMYDISDMLDDFEVHTDLWAGVVRKVTMPDKMKKMRIRLENITKEHESFSLKLDTGCSLQQTTNQRETAGTENEAEVFGRTEEKQEILASLSRSATDETTFLPIWGFGGIGKTTLARWVFNHSQFKDYSRVWVYVSQTFDLKKIGNSIISQLSGKEDQSKLEDLHIIHNRLEKLLADNKKILIILDDLWEKSTSVELGKLKAMIKQGEGCNVMIVVTTREESIAQEIATVAPCNLAPFTAEMCWKIIKQKCNFKAHPDKRRLKPTGKEIAKKCGGVPLAAQSLGHMLKEFRRYDEWVSVRDSNIWNLPSSRNSSSIQYDVLASLMLSYNLMSPYLKICFAYCAIFPKGHDIPKDKLIHQWIALGFMEPSGIFSSMQLGESYVSQLLKMSFLQYSKADDDAYVPRFIMHDLVHDLAISVMADEFNLEGPNCRYARLTDYTKPLKASTTSPAKIRALDIADNCHAYTAAKHLRVLALRKEFPAFIGQLKQLRYLSAPCIRVPINPRVISKLSKLNYLDLHGCTLLSELPESFGEMNGLMHLDLSQCENMLHLPLSFANLKKLVYLDLLGCHALLGIPEALRGLTKLQHLDLSECGNLRGLPEVIGNLTDLRYLNLSYCMNHIFQSSSTDQAERFIDRICALPYMEHLDLSCNRYPLVIPKSARHLKKLDLTLCNVNRLPECVAEMDSRGLFGLLSSSSVVYGYYSVSKSNLYLLEHANPREVEINMLETVKYEEANSINLSEKRSIEELTLEWTKYAERSTEDMELLRELVPPTTLQKFVIKGYRSVSFPDWLMGISNYLPNLVDMTMVDLPNCNCLPALTQLPNLRSLTLWGMKSLEEWNTGYASGMRNELMFPLLEKLFIHGCPKLRIKPHLPVAASWNICRSDNVLRSSQKSVSHIDEIILESSKLPLHQWSLLHHLPSLGYLYISRCSDLTISPEITPALRSLKSLRLDELNHKELEELFGELRSLQHLSIQYNMKLEKLPDNMRQLTQLQSLKLRFCRSLRQLPPWLGELVSLRELEVNCCDVIKTLPESIQQLAHLHELKILGCIELENWCQAEENKTKLAHIEQKRIGASGPPATRAVPQHLGCLAFMGLKKEQKDPEL